MARSRGPELERVRQFVRLLRRGGPRCYFVGEVYPASYLVARGAFGRLVTLRGGEGDPWERDLLLRRGARIAGDRFDGDTGLVRTDTIPPPPPAHFAKPRHAAAFGNAARPPRRARLLTTAVPPSPRDPPGHGNRAVRTARPTLYLVDGERRMTDRGGVELEGVAFEAFFADAEPRLRRALVAVHGADRGREAAAEALAYGWQHWDRVRAMDNPVGYLYRVGQSRIRSRATPPLFPPPPDDASRWIEPELPGALRALSERERLAVVLIEGFGWTYREVAELTDVSISSVQSYLNRGLRKLRTSLGVSEGA